MSLLRDQEFRQPVPDDSDGDVQVEEEEHLCEIVKLNDVPNLERYLERKPFLGPGPDLDYAEDVYWIAAAYGSTVALRTLLIYLDATHPGYPTGPESDSPDSGYWKYGLLQPACMNAQIETVYFLLDGPWNNIHGDIHKKDWGTNYTAILAAACSFIETPLSAKDSQNTHSLLEHQSQYIARCEQLMHLLLDRGASARDTTTFGRPEWKEANETVLSLAITRANSALVRRLIDEGADPDMTVVREARLLDPVLIVIEEGFSGIVHGVTPLHIGSLYANTEGIQALLDRGNVSHKPDSFGRLPIHWAAHRNEDEFYKLELPEIDSHIIDTISLLLRNNPTKINAQDNQGNTALHYAVRSHGDYGSYIAIPKLLCELGADARSRNLKNQTPLHNAVRIRGDYVLSTDYNEPLINPIIDLLLAHGASVADTDSDDNTPLHLVAKSLALSDVAQRLLSQGSNVHAVNKKGNTPLHEAASGVLHYRQNKLRKGPSHLTADERVRAQDRMIAILLGDVSEEMAGVLMDQSNAEGRSVREILELTRSRWREDEVSHMDRMRAEAERQAQWISRLRRAGQ